MNKSQELQPHRQKRADCPLQQCILGARKIDFFCFITDEPSMCVGRTTNLTNPRHGDRAWAYFTGDVRLSSKMPLPWFIWRGLPQHCGFLNPGDARTTNFGTSPIG